VVWRVAMGAIDVWAQITTEHAEATLDADPAEMDGAERKHAGDRRDDAACDGRGQRRYRLAVGLARAGRLPDFERRGGANGCGGSDQVPRPGECRSGKTDGWRT